VRLLTMNIWARNGDWDTRRRLLHDLFAELDPDLLVLQETVVSEGHDQVRELLGDDVEIAHSTVRDGEGTGISTVSRWPIRAAHELDLRAGSRTRDFPATTLLAEIDTPDGPLVLVNHFPSWKLHLEAERCAQTLLAARAVEELAPDLDAPVVVAGDLDADPTADSVRFWTGRHPLDGFSVCYRDAWDAIHPAEPGHTYTPDNPLLVDEDWPFRRIDHVLVRCAEHGGAALRIRDCRVVGDDPPASDHYGLVADLEPREAPADRVITGT
jgi:endonuclease/exonuclease/phosphatase family metal-dependent hydrolase